MICHTTKTIYIVKGETGEYDNYNEWDVMAFSNKEEAITHMQTCQDWVDMYINPTSLSQFRELCNLKNPFDSYMRVDYTGVHYGISSLQLKENL